MYQPFRYQDRTSRREVCLMFLHLGGVNSNTWGRRSPKAWDKCLQSSYGSRFDNRHTSFFRIFFMKIVFTINLYCTSLIWKRLFYTCTCVYRRNNKSNNCMTPIFILSTKMYLTEHDLWISLINTRKNRYLRRYTHVALER